MWKHRHPVCRYSFRTERSRKLRALASEPARLTADYSRMTFFSSTVAGSCQRLAEVEVFRVSRKKCRNLLSMLGFQQFRLPCRNPARRGGDRVPDADNASQSLRLDVPGAKRRPLQCYLTPRAGRSSGLGKLRVARAAMKRPMPVIVRRLLPGSAPVDPKD